VKDETGLSWVAAQCDDLEDLPLEELDCLAEQGPVAAMLLVAERSVAALPRPAARRLGQDIRLLLESSLSDATIRTVWLGATDQVFDPAKSGSTARAWLRQMEEAWLEAERRGTPGFVPDPVTQETDKEVEQGVLGVIGMVSGDLTATVGNRVYPLPLPNLVPALEQVTVHADADLAFRMVLRALKANQLPVDDRTVGVLVTLGTRLGHARSLVTEDLNHQS
jgi:hypothetical protein